MAAATCTVKANHRNRSITYSFSEAIYFLLTADGTTKVEPGGTASTDITEHFAVYKPALSGTYAAPDATAGTGNSYTGVTLVSVIFAADGKSYTVTYTGDFAAIDATAFGYTVYPIGHKAYTVAADTDSSANHKQACFQTPKEITVSTATGPNAEIELTATAISTTGGAMITTTWRDEKVVLIFLNADSGNSETVTFYEGDGQQSISSSKDIAIAASSKSAVQLESGRYKHLYHSLLKGKYYIEGTSDVSVIAIQIPL